MGGVGVGRLVDTLPFLGAAAVLLAAPFETLDPLISLPGQDLTSLEAVFAVAMALWTASLALARRVPRWRGPLSAPALAFVAALAGSAALAAEYPREAWLFTGRQTAGLLFFFLVLDAADSRAKLRGLMACAVLAGTVSAALGIADFLNFEWVGRALPPFRAQTFTVGLLPRASATLQYPTIAAMYLEIILAFALGLTLQKGGPGGWNRARWAALAAGVVGACLVLTLTRAGWAVAGLLLGLGGWAALRPAPDVRAFRRIAALAALLGALWVALAISDPAFLLRGTADPADWYRVEYTIPATLEMSAGEQRSIVVRVRNAGRAAWDSTEEPSVRLSYHWMNADGSQSLVWDGVRTPLPGRVEPGQEVEFAAAVAAPGSPGDYTLLWDMLAEHRFWFSLEGSPAGRTSVRVTGPSVAPPPDATPRPAGRFRLSRGELARVGLELFWRNPWLGVGADNFRLVYGRYLDLETYDLTYHAHNLPIEILATTGLAGGLPLIWLGLAMAAAAWRGVARSTPDRPLMVGLALAAAAIAAHGLVDYFLEFTATYLMIWGVVGLMAAGDASRRLGAGSPSGD